MTEWVSFFAVILALVLLDLYGFDRKNETPTLKLSVLKTLFYIAVAGVFGGWIALSRGPDDALKFLTGYALESSLSFDNVFVIGLIMGALAIPQGLRSTVLFYGIAGAIVLRGLFIGLGTAIVGQFHWLLVGFAVFLIFTGGKLLVSKDDEDDYDIEQSKTLKLLRRFFPITEQMHGRKLWVAGEMTPLFVAIVLVEITDLLFAVDSIPATFAVTTDPFLAFTSNIFAVIGLRSLFFVLQAMVNRFSYLNTALAWVLVFIGVKVILAELHWVDIPILLSLGIVIGMLAAGVVASVMANKGRVERY